MEAKSDIRFFYLSRWTDSITIIQDSGEPDIMTILRRTLENTRIDLFVADEKTIILTHNYRIVPGLPQSFRMEENRVVKKNPAYSNSSFIRADSLRQASAGRNKEIVIGIPGQLQGSRKAVISGVIRAKESGESIIGAVVYVKDLAIGTTTDGTGYYVIQIPAGKHELLVKFLGRKDESGSVLVNGDGTLNFYLEEKLIELRDVVITADKEQNVSGLQLGLDKVDIQSIRQIPTSMGEADLIKTALMLPGVQTVGEGAPGFNVRGGSTDQNLFLIDGSPVFNTSHVFGFFSIFNPDIIKEFKLYKSNIPANYGGRLSSVFDVGIRNGNLNKYTLSGGISPVTARLCFEGPVIKDKASMIISGRSTYSDWVLHEVDVPALKRSSAEFNDFNAKFGYEMNEKNTLTLSTYYSHDYFKFNSDTSYNYSNMNGTISLKHTFSKKFYGLFSFIFSDYRNSIQNDKKGPGSFRMDYSIQYKEGKADFSYFLNQKHRLNFGINATGYEILPGKLMPNANESMISGVILPSEKAVETGIYISDEHNFSNRILLSYGFRFSGYFLLGPGIVYHYLPGVPRSLQSRADTSVYEAGQVISKTGYPELRLALRYKITGTSSFKLSYTEMDQYLHLLSNTTAISPTDTWKLSGPNLPSQRSRQFSAGFYKDMLDNTIESSAEFYYKSSRNILEYRGGTNLFMNPELEIDLLKGKAKAYGAEIVFKKKYGTLNGWVSYSYSRSFMKVDSRHIIDQINKGDYYPSNYDKPHDFTVVSNYRISRTYNFSSTFTYSTGRPITYPVGKYMFNGRELVHYSNRNEYRIPDYLRWDLSLNIEGSLKARKFIRNYWTISIYNLTGRDNAYSIFFVSDTEEKIKGYKLSVFSQPVLTVSYNFRF